MPVTKVFVAGFTRTAFAKAGKGALRDAHPVDYSAQLLKGVLNKVAVSANEIDALLFGCAMPEGATGNNIARAVAVAAGCISLPATTISTWCASSLDAIAWATGRIASGTAAAVLVGGVEAMTHTWNRGLNEHFATEPLLLGSHPAYYGSPIADADFLTRKHGLSREVADEIALLSHQRAAAAVQQGLFAQEILPVYAPDSKQSFDTDECIRVDTSAQALAALKVVGEDPASITTAGNASQRADGAALCLLVGESFARQHDLNVSAEILGLVSVGIEPAEQLTGPAVAIPRLLQKHGLHIDDIDLWEIHEAFGCQVAYCRDTLNLPIERLNVNGGAIALGHPFGASGARLIGHAALELQRRAARRAVVGMCCGGGQGYAALLGPP
jgi:acetyl-CoA C-acetyltransferase